ncbi:MAG: acetyl-CoA carboxylase carboxyltransferase subunit alpha [Lachnospiraceae bacterium]|nr:acetyl-CoA carboxylase carboxyltransferase subunit alpha [Lachnospiraceae bacterium]
MDFNHIFKKTPKSNRTIRNEKRKPEVPEGLMKKCNLCGRGIFVEECEKNLYICPKCGGYLRMPADKRVENIVDAHSFEEWDLGLENENPLKLKNYPAKIKELKIRTGLDEAVMTGQAKIGGQDVVLMVMDCRFLTASMGEVVGEKITRGIEKATERKLPVVIFTCSGGARMQEGMTSLMQMAKTSAALKRHSEAGLLYVSVLTNPTTGGVTASFAMLGDIILAEPDALIGFAGPRVIEQTIGQKLPKGFQRSEFLLEHGFIDQIVKREQMRDMLIKILDFHKPKTEILSFKTSSKPSKVLMKKKNEKSAWDRVQISRQSERPVGEDYIQEIFEDFMEFHGDRLYGDDPAVCGGVAKFHGRPVTVLAQMKGKSTKENVKRNFGMPLPEGYRKALRLMKQAEKFHRPVICFVDTPGAFCGMEAEERGQGEAIAKNLFEMSDLKTPVLSVFIGEGGSGGALALAVADEVWMLENAVYSILSPEGFASILWKDAKLAQNAAKVMKLTSYDLYHAGFIDDIIMEPEEYTSDSMQKVCIDLEEKICIFLNKMSEKSIDEFINDRYDRFRKM